MKNYKKLISAKPVLLAAIALIAIIVPMSASAANDAIVLSSGNAYVGNGPEGIAIAASYDESGKLTYIRTKHVDKDCVARFDVEKTTRLCIGPQSEMQNRLPMPLP